MPKTEPTDAPLTATAAGRLFDPPIAGSSVTALARRRRLPFAFDSSNRIRLYRRSDVVALAKERAAEAAKR
jgi:hypothetical protein